MQNILNLVNELTDQFPGGDRRRIERELARPYTYSIDLLRAISLVQSRVMFTDFREKYSLRDRKIFKVATLLALPDAFFHAIEFGSRKQLGLPANIVLSDSLVSMYASLENTCVRLPKSGFSLESEWTRLPTIFDYLKEDLAVISPQYHPDVMIASLKETNLGTKLVASKEQLDRWSSTAGSILIGFENAMYRRKVPPETYTSAVLFTEEMFRQIYQEVYALEHNNMLERTYLVYRIQTRR